MAALLAVATPGCTGRPAPVAASAEASTSQSLALFDVSRQRAVPVALYGAVGGRTKPLAVIAHGYGSANTEYSFLTQALVARGYVVASVQLDLPGDLPMPTQGEPAVVRRPNWERGADTLEFAIRTLRDRRIASTAPVLLVGHSNGGDIAMLLATRRPELIGTVFSLDNRRMTFPRTADPHICSVRSADQVADPGVLPSPEEQARYAMVIGTVPGLIHDDMSDAATPAQKAAVIALLERCLSRS